MPQKTIADVVPERQEETQAVLMAALMEKEKRAESLLQEANASAELIKLDAQKKQEELLEEARAQAEHIKEEARTAGHEEGFAAGREEGLAKAQEEAADSIRAANEKAQRTMETAREEMRIYLHQAEKDVTDIALHVVEKILPQHFIDVPQVILPLVRQALRKVQDQAQVIVHTAPDAYELVLMAQPEFQSMLEGNATLSVVSDDSLQMGDCILETPNGNVDARLATQLELIKQAVQDVRL